jgi:hypothetical protein
MGKQWRFRLSALHHWVTTIQNQLSQPVPCEGQGEALKFTRNRYQKGSLRKVSRKSGSDVWEYRPTGVFNGRIGKVKTEVLNGWRGTRSKGLVFPSHVTGGCSYSGVIQMQILKSKGEGIGILGGG